MKAGRQLDALIAEKVMGWNITELTHATAWTDEEGGWTLKQMWKPSTRIQDAWVVVEKMEELGFELHLDSSLNDFGIKLYFCEFSNQDNTIITGSDGEQAPFVICLSALQAVGENKGLDGVHDEC